jgi:hypothetical protein
VNNPELAASLVCAWGMYMHLWCAGWAMAAGLGPHLGPWGACITLNPTTSNRQAGALELADALRNAGAIGDADLAVEATGARRRKLLAELPDKVGTANRSACGCQ